MPSAPPGPPGHPHQRIADYPFVNDPGRWENAGRDFVFTFVRNPFARMLSAYLNKIVHHRDPSVWGRFAARHGLGDAPLPFREFLELVARTPPAQMDMHWRPQSHTVAPHAVAYDFVGSMERFEEDLGLVLTRIFGRDLPVHEHAPHRTGSTDQLAEYYGAEEIDSVRRICAVDFRELGYSTDPARQMREPRPGASRPDAMQAWGTAWRLFAQQEFAAAAATLEPTTPTLTGPVAADRLLRCHLALLARGGPAAVPESRKHVSEALALGLGAADDVEGARPGHAGRGPCGGGAHRPAAGGPDAQPGQVQPAPDRAAAAKAGLAARARGPPHGGDGHTGPGRASSRCRRPAAAANRDGRRRPSGHGERGRSRCGRHGPGRSSRCCKSHAHKPRRGTAQGDDPASAR